MKVIIFLFTYTSAFVNGSNSLANFSEPDTVNQIWKTCADMVPLTSIVQISKVKAIAESACFGRGAGNSGRFHELYKKETTKLLLRNRQWRPELYMDDGKNALLKLDLCLTNKTSTIRFVFLCNMTYGELSRSGISYSGSTQPNAIIGKCIKKELTWCEHGARKT